MDGPLYKDYIEHCFVPWLKSKNIKFPVLLLVDGHKSHYTYNVCKVCAENNIIQYALYPNSTHIIQPADVSVFKTLKSGWDREVYEWKRKSNHKAVTKAMFGNLLQKVYDEKVTKEVNNNGFRKCGLFPFDANAIDFPKCMDHPSRSHPPIELTDTITKPTHFGVEHILFLESVMKRGRVEEFRSAVNIGSWSGDTEASELFEV